MRVCLGGTFDRLHVGHEALLRKAFEVGDEVFIGVTSQRLAQRGRDRKVRPFEARKRALERFILRRGWNAFVSEIDRPEGRALEPRYNAIVVSPETHDRAHQINLKRRRLGRKPLRVFTIPFLYSNDGLRLSATRVAAGEIDARGRRRTVLRIGVGTRNALKARAVGDAFRRAFPRLRVQVRSFRTASGVPEQPLGAQTHRGARQRANSALKAWPGADYGVGVEAGLVEDAFLGRRLDVQYVVVVDKQGGTSAGHGGGFYYPDAFTRDVLKGRTISQVVGPVAGDARIGSTVGAVGYLTRGALTRRSLTAHGVLLALVPRLRRELYQE